MQNLAISKHTFASFLTFINAKIYVFELSYKGGVLDNTRILSYTGFYLITIII